MQEKCFLEKRSSEESERKGSKDSFTSQKATVEKFSLSLGAADRAHAWTHFLPKDGDKHMLGEDKGDGRKSEGKVKNNAGKR